VNCRTTKPLELIHFETEPPLSLGDWLTETRELLVGGSRPIAVFGQLSDTGIGVWIAFASAATGQVCLTNTSFPVTQAKDPT
jgi:hypothetical protein